MSKTTISFSPEMPESQTVEGYEALEFQGMPAPKSNEVVEVRCDKLGFAPLGEKHTNNEYTKVYGDGTEAPATVHEYRDWIGIPADAAIRQ